MANNLAAFNADQFSTKTVEILNQNNVMLAHVNRDWEGDLSKGLGSTVWVRTLGNITTAPYTRGATINYQDLTPAKEAFTVNDAQVFAFAVDDLDDAQNDIDALDAYAERAAVTLNDLVEAKILSAYSSAHTDNKVTGAANAAITLDKTNIYSAAFVAAAQRLDAKKVPSKGRFAIIGSIEKSLLAQSTEMVRNTPMGDATVRGLGGEGNYLGNIAGFETYWSTACPEDANARYLTFGDNKAIAYAAQLNEVEMLRLQVTMADAIRGLLLHDKFVSAESSKRLATVKATK